MLIEITPQIAAGYDVLVKDPPTSGSRRLEIPVHSEADAATVLGMITDIVAQIAAELERNAALAKQADQPGRVVPGGGKGRMRG